MRLHHPRHRAAALAAAAALALSTCAAAAAPAAAANKPAAGPAAIPAEVYAPYFETYLTRSNVATVAKASGAHYLTLAFIQTASKGSCTATWNGNPKEPLSGGHYLRQIAAVRAMGGNVIPSFGGYGADSTGTEIADSCTNVNKIAAVYELLVSKYHVTRLDMDVEAHSLGNGPGINRRNKAIAMAQHWAAARGITLQVDFTLPVEPDGLQSPGLNVVRNALAQGVKIGVVNIMTFDYYQTHEGHVNMAAAAMAAALNLHNQLSALYPKDTPRQLWKMEGMTLLPGIDDRGRIETTWLSSMARVVAFATNEHMSLLSIWAVQRDNGGCPGTTDSNTCSGVRQRPWAFSHLMEPFTH